MADLEKNILVVIPVNEDHKKFLEEKAASGDFPAVHISDEIGRASCRERV